MLRATNCADAYHPMSSTSCSATFCRNEERPKCRTCGTLDKKSSFEQRVQAWKLSPEFAPMPNSVGDIHAYLCTRCHANAEKTNTGAGAGAAADTGTDDEDGDVMDTDPSVPSVITTPHVRDEIFVRNRVRARQGIAANRFELREPRGRMKPFRVTDRSDKKQAYAAITRLVNDTDADNPAILKFLADKQRAIQPDADPDFVRSKALRRERLLELSAWNTAEREFMCVVFRERQPGMADYSVPIASTIFTAEGKKAEMDVNMLEGEDAVEAPRSIQTLSLRSTKNPRKANATRTRTMHVDMVYVDPAFAGNSLGVTMLQYIEDIVPDNTVYMGFFTGMENKAMQKTGLKVGMRPNSSRLPPGYRDGGFDTSLMKALPATPGFAPAHRQRRK